MRVCFVIPVFNEAATLRELTEGIQLHAQPWQHRILFIDDGSTDSTPTVLRELRDAHGNVDVIRLRRNFGKTRALAVGFARGEGDLFITMDGDLQDRPEEIPALIAKFEEGFDLVCGWKAARKDPGHKVALSRVYNRWLSALFGIDLHDVNTGFKAIRGDLARRLPLFGDMHRMMVAFAARGGYRVAEVAVEHAPRRHGASKYGLRRYYRGTVDALLAWLLTRNEQLPSIRVAFLVAAILASILSLVLCSAGYTAEGAFLRWAVILAGVLVAAFVGGALIVAWFVLPMGEWMALRLSDGELERGILEENLG